MNSKVIDLTILALEKGHTLEQVVRFFHMISNYTIEETQSKTIITGNLD